jgi:hypothetical protein
MIERLANKSDIKKIENDLNFKDVLDELNESEEYLEIVQDKFIFLGLRPKGGREILQIEDADLINFLRLLRDNFNLWKELVSIKKSAHKQFYQTFLKSNFFTVLSRRLEKAVMNDSQKLSKKIHSIKDKIQLLHDRLQGVFLVSGKRKELVISLDTKKSLIVTKIVDASTENDFTWMKDIRAAKVLVFAPDDSAIAKSLRALEFVRLPIARKKCKNIWIKNHK